MADPELVRLLEQSADRNVAAIDRLRDELIADRRRDDERIGALEHRFDALARELRELAQTVQEIDDRCGALVVTETGPNGEQIVTARPAQLGLDAKTLIGAVVTLVTAGAVPVLIAILSQGGTP